MEATKIVWHDPNINNIENTHGKLYYLVGLDAKLFSTVGETSNFLKRTPEKWVLITSGRNGQLLVDQIHDLESVIGIVIFAMAVDYHRQGSGSFQKVRAVEASGFKKVMKHVRSIYSDYVTLEVINCVKNPSDPVKQLKSAIQNTIYGPNSSMHEESSGLNYYHMQENLEMSFRQVSKLAMRNEKIPRSSVLTELQSLKPGEKLAIAREFNKFENDLLRSIIGTYSTDLIYNELNKCYAENKYASVMHITAACALELKSRLELLAPRETVLYRGVNIPDIESYKLGQTGFGSAFTSTSTDERVARQFHGNVFFIVHLSSSNPHPHISLPQGWSKYDSEKEVLLLPYFPLRIESIQKEGSLYTITVRQNKDQTSLSFDNARINNYGNERIEEIVSSTYGICLRIKQTAISSINLYEYFTVHFEKDMNGIIGSYYEKNREKVLHSLTPNPDALEISLLECGNIMKKDVKLQVIEKIKSNIKAILNIEFLRLKKCLVNIISEELYGKFQVPEGDELAELIKLIFEYALQFGSSFSEPKKLSINEVIDETEIKNYTKPQLEIARRDPKSYLRIFTNELLKILKNSIMHYSGMIDEVNQVLKNRLKSQIEEMRNKIQETLQKSIL